MTGIGRQKFLLFLSTVQFVCLTFASASNTVERRDDRLCKNVLERTRQVPISNALKLLARTGNIHAWVEELERRYEGLSFRIPLGRLAAHRTLFILQERDLISDVMRKESRLPFVNRNFDASHGHFHSINSVNTTDPLWHDLHNELADIFKTHSIVEIMERHKGLLLEDPTYNLNDRLEEYFLRVWGEYCFGPVPFAQFRHMRNRLVEVLGRVFHQNPVNRLPWIGAATSRFNYWRHREELSAVDQELSAVLSLAISNQQGAFYELYKRLQPKYENAYEITRDNSFLAVLVYDFIHIVMLDAFVHIAKYPERDREAQVRQSRHDGFLYPFRFRVVAEDFDEYKKGDFVVVNLQKSQLHFSHGARRCPGAGLFSEIAKTMLAFFQDYQLALTHPEQEIERSPNRDLPFMLSRHDVQILQCPHHSSRPPGDH